MSKEKFKLTIEYKEKERLIKLILTTAIIFFVVFVIVAVALSSILFKDSPKIASVVLVSIIIVYLIADLPFIIYYFYLKRKLSKILNYLPTMVVFSCKLGTAAEHKNTQSRYLITFEYKNASKSLMSSWIYDSNDLENKVVEIGYIEELNHVMVLAKK